MMSDLATHIHQGKLCFSGARPGLFKWQEKPIRGGRRGSSPGKALVLTPHWSAEVMWPQYSPLIGQLRDDDSGRPDGAQPVPGGGVRHGHALGPRPLPRGGQGGRRVVLRPLRSQLPGVSEPDVLHWSNSKYKVSLIKCFTLSSTLPREWLDGESSLRP